MGAQTLPGALACAAETWKAIHEKEPSRALPAESGRTRDGIWQCWHARRPVGQRKVEVGFQTQAGTTPPRHSRERGSPGVDLAETMAPQEALLLESRFRGNDEDDEAEWPSHTIGSLHSQLHDLGRIAIQRTTVPFSSS